MSPTRRRTGVSSNATPINFAILRSQSSPILTYTLRTLRLAPPSGLVMLVIWTRTQFTPFLAIGSDSLEEHSRCES